MPTTALNGIDIAYQRVGVAGAPRVLFLNGSGGTLETAAPIIDTLSEHVDLLAHDQRGLGRTSVPAGPYEMAQYAQDAIALLDHVGWSSCRVIGISFGGMVAQELAVTVPERIERLALWCTSPGGDGGSSYPLHEMAALTADERAQVGTPLQDSRFTPEWLQTHPEHAALVAMSARRAARERTSAQRRGEAEQLDARRRHDVWDRLPRISCPTLVGCGRHDGIAPVDNGTAIASRIAGSDLRIYDGGHLFFAQDHTAFPDLIRFLTADAPTRGAQR